MRILLACLMLALPIEAAASQCYAFVKDLRRDWQVRYAKLGAIAGTLVEVGQGKIGADAVAEILESRDRDRAGITAPAHGLTLMEVRYDEAPRAVYPVPEEIR